MFTEEELLEAVDILVEDYGYDEEEAIDMVNEAYEAELDELSEAVDILMEDYDLDEEEAIDIIVESYEDDFEEEDEDGLVSEAGRRHLGFASKSETLAQKARKGVKRGRRRIEKTSAARKRKIARKAAMKKMDKRIKRAKKAMNMGGRKRRRRC